jgi:hypothetical protein
LAAGGPELLAAGLSVDALAFCGVLTFVFLVYQNDLASKRPGAPRVRSRPGHLGDIIVQCNKGQADHSARRIRQTDNIH